MNNYVKNHVFKWKKT